MATKTTSGLKNHIKSRFSEGKTHGTTEIFQLLEPTYGFDLNTIDAAMRGDEAALRTLGELGRQGRVTQEIMPLVVEQSLNAIKGTEVYNVGVSKIAVEGAKSKTKIDKASNQALLATQQYTHDQSLLALEYGQSLDSINAKSAQTREYLNLKHYVATYLQDIDHQYRILQETQRPVVKQFSEDERYGFAIAQHYLQHGDMSRPELVPHKQYELAPQTSTWGTFTSKLGDLAQAVKAGLGV